MSKICSYEAFDPEITCPHCRAQFCDSDQIDEDKAKGVEVCAECGGRFRWSRQVRITYSSVKLGAKK
jgi:transcription elongation factor Elf1